MIVGYARVSTTDQDMSLQLDALRAAGVEKIFSDVASGVLERPQLMAALDFVREGDTIVVWRLDRLGRSIIDLIKTVQALDDRKIHIMSLREHLDTSTSAGRLMFNVFAALAEYEREIIRERISAGIRAARARGRCGGRKEKLNTKNRRIAIEMYYDTSRCYAVADICTTLKITRQTLYNYLYKHEQEVLLKRQQQQNQLRAD